MQQICFLRNCVTLTDGAYCASGIVCHAERKAASHEKKKKKKWPSATSSVISPLVSISYFTIPLRAFFSKSDQPIKKGIKAHISVLSNSVLLG